MIFRSPCGQIKQKTSSESLQIANEAPHSTFTRAVSEFFCVLRLLFIIYDFFVAYKVNALYIINKICYYSQS